MKKTVFWVLLALLWSVSASPAAELKIGDKAMGFKLQDSTGKEFSLDSPDFKGRVMSIFYVDPDEKDMNSHVEDVLLKDPGLDRKVNYKGLGITNMKASALPNFIIKGVIKSKQEKTGAVILLDYDYTILNLWGLKNDSSNLVILDKERICRYIYKEKLPPEEVAKMLAIIKEYQVK
jgi:predicted transcriptional regulator